MKRIFLSLLLTGLCTFCPAMADEITMEVTQTADSQWMLYVSLDNPSTIYSGFQMDMVLPDGITLNTSTVTKTSRTTNLTMQASIADNGLPRVVGYSSKKTNNITGTTGRIFSVQLDVADGMGGGMYELSAKNLRLTTTAGVETVLPNATCILTINESDIYILTFWDGDEIYYTIAMEAGAPINPISDPDPKEGYTFCGWGDVPATMPNHSLELHAIWCAISYAVHYMVDGEVVHTEMVAYGKTLPDFTPAEIEGYTFCGWDNAPATMPSHDVELTAKYCVNSYELKYIVEGETVFTEQVAYDSPMPSFNAPVIDGRVFLGWDGEEYSTMPAHDVAYTAQYTSLADVNRDGTVNTADVVAVYTYIEQGEASGFTREAVNVNGDAAVNTADVVRIYNVIINGD